MRAILWDLDNCLSDDAWRIPQINWRATDPDERYDVYHRLCSGDPPGNLVFFQTESARLQADACFVTARPEWVRHMTSTWLRRHVLGVFPADARLLMRARGDRSHSREMKLRAVDRLLEREPMLNIVGAFDDRQDVVAMYREHFGIATASVLAIHSVCAYTDPTKGK